MKQKILFVLMLLMVVLNVSAYDFEVNGIYYNILDGENSVSVTHQYAYDWAGPSSYSGNVQIPETVTYDGVTYTVKAIGTCAFYECSELGSVVMPNSVTSIGDYAFSCSGLESVVMSASVKNIGDYAFEDTQIYYVWLPDSVTTIGRGAFYHCIYLGILFIPNSVTAIGNSAFASCSALTVLTIGNSVTTIGDYTFSECSGLTSVEIPNPVTSIGFMAFCNCSGLTSVEMGKSITSIGDEAFDGCSGLTSVTCYATNPPGCGSNDTFTSTTYNGALFVPKPSLVAYRNAYCWKKFVNIQAILDYVPGDIDGDGVLTVDDATGIISMILNGTASIEENPAADINGDGVIDIDDITAIIIQILG